MKKVKIHSSTLAWEISQTEESSGPQPLGSQRVRPSLATEHTRPYDASHSWACGTAVLKAVLPQDAISGASGWRRAPRT